MASQLHHIALFALLVICLSCEKQDVQIAEELLNVTDPIQLIGSWNTIAYEIDPSGDTIRRSNVFVTDIMEDGSFETNYQVGWCGWPDWRETKGWEIDNFNTVWFIKENCYPSTFNNIDCFEERRRTSARTTQDNNKLFIQLLVTGGCASNGVFFKHQELTRR